MDNTIIDEIIKIIIYEEELLFSEISMSLDCLLMTIDINSLDEKGDSFLHHSVSKQKYDITEYLLQKGINPNIKNPHGETAFLQACRKGRMSFVQLLFKYGANPDIYDNSNDSPLLWASYHGFVDVVIFLIENGANPYNKFRDGRDAIKWAVRENNLSVVIYLSEYLNNILDRDTYGDTIMDIKTSPEIKSYLNNIIQKNKIVLLKYFINNQSEITEFNLANMIGKYYYIEDD